jgi:hypothetical protein
MLVLQAVRAKSEIQETPIPGHRAIMVRTVLAGVKGSLALLGGCAALDPGCASRLLAFKRWPGGVTRRIDPGARKRSGCSANGKLSCLDPANSCRIALRSAARAC